MLGHNVYVYLICLHHARSFSEWFYHLLPHEATCIPASLTTLSIIQLSNFCQFNIVNLTFFSLIITVSKPSGTSWFGEFSVNYTFIFLTCFPIAVTDLSVYRNSLLIINSLPVLDIENTFSYLVIY